MLSLISGYYVRTKPTKKGIRYSAYPKCDSPLRDWRGAALLLFRLNLRNHRSLLCVNRSSIPCMAIVPAQKLSSVNIGLN